jgi:hypothetical protein
MAYTYTITRELICEVKSDDVVVDSSGPWESEAAASNWASAYTNRLNLGLDS